jgi:RNA polymerase sigma-70 factor (ECF subfamily)
MVEPLDPSREYTHQRLRGAAVNVRDVEEWFVREVLPLETTLTHFLRRNWRKKSEIPDLRQEVYARVYEAALTEIPGNIKPFVLATARNLLINEMRRDRVVSIEAVADLEKVDIGSPEVPQDRALIARQELRLLQDALAKLPRRCRQAVTLRKLEGLSRREIAVRMGVSDNTVRRHLIDGMRVLAEKLHGDETKPEGAQ